MLLTSSKAILQEPRLFEAGERGGFRYPAQWSVKVIEGRMEYYLTLPVDKGSFESVPVLEPVSFSATVESVYSGKSGTRFTLSAFSVSSVVSAATKGGKS